jgi:redox-sensitive bicupin YhaK (pirin superfamily)
MLGTKKFMYHYSRLRSIQPFLASAMTMTMMVNSPSKKTTRWFGKSTELVPGMVVRRILPQIQCRSIGPFVFLDHFGPIIIPITPGGGTQGMMNVGPHPHIGLCTLTFLYQGGILHRDSTGIEQPILPDQVNWMCSGKGVTHSERPLLPSQQSSPSTTPRFKELHGLQLWVALPKDYEDVDPSFHHSSSIVSMESPIVTVGEVQTKLIVGKFLGYEQTGIPLLPGMEDLFLVSVEFQDENSEWQSPPLRGDIKKKEEEDNWQVGIYVTSGIATIINHDHPEDSSTLSVGEIMVLKSGSSRLSIRGTNDCKVILLGGAAYPEKRHLLWNFCSWDTNKLKDAADAWDRLDRNKFPPVYNESNDDSIPIPKRHKKS